MRMLQVSAGPHIRCPRTTARIMGDVLIALFPALVMSMLLFGFRALAVVAVCVGVCVLSEFIFDLITGKEQTVTDLSAVVTGVILAFNLPYTIPLWQAALGSVVAIVVVKCLFGGLGCNFANPALVGRIVLFISFTSSMNAPTGNFDTPVGIDMVSGATPLTQADAGAEVTASYLDMLFGTHGGMLGEVCALALIAGGIYLIARRVITYHIPVAFIGTVALFSLCCGRDPLTDVLSGGLLLGAIFMATDYVTSPETPVGKLIYGVGCGLVTMFIRHFCTYPEGVSYAILLMNILTPYISNLTRKHPVGGKKA